MSPKTKKPVHEGPVFWYNYSMIETNNYTVNYTPNQLILPMDLSINLPRNSEVRTYAELMKGIDLGKYFTKREETRGRIPKNRVRILNAILFGYMVDVRSSRALESACKYDIRFMWLMGDMKAPSHTLIATVITELSQDLKKIFKEVLEVIEAKDKTDTNILYIDGTKIEADANRYTFVWKKAIVKHQARLHLKISKTLEHLKTLSLVDIPIQKSYKSSTLKRIVSKVKTILECESIALVYGKGQKKTPIQRVYDALVAYEEKMREYERHLKIIGPERGSYSKTDHDATFLHMKEDHMRNSQLKPGYNVQIGVSNEYIRLIEAYPYRNDLNTFEPFMESYHTMHAHYPLYPVADAGYGRYDTYHYCLEKGMGLYQKHNMWAIERTKAYKNNPFNRDNFNQDKKGNYICPKGRKLTYRYSKRNNKIKRNHEIKVYECETCKRCPLTKQCKKAKHERQIHINETWESMKSEVRKNLESPLGIDLRIQRSIQVEGAFGIIKEDMRFRRFSRTGYQGISNELNLIAIGYNLKKFHNKQQRVIQ